MTEKKTIAIDIRKCLRPKTGIGNYIEALVNKLIRVGPEFEYLLLGDKPVSKKEIPDGCRYVQLGCFYREGGRLAQLYSPYWMNVIVPQFLNLKKITLFHGPNFVIPAKADCPCVATIHDLAFLKVPTAYTRIYRKYIKFQVQSAIKRASAIIAVSEATKNDLISLMKVAEEKIFVIYHGISEKFRPVNDSSFLEKVRKELQLPERFLLDVGVIERRKNIETLLRAAEPLIKEGLTDGVVFAGKDGLGANEIRQFSAKLRIASQVQFLGYVPDDLLVALYNLAQCLVFPSWYEGFGLPILEAMACGCPVVAADSSSIPEAAGDAALLFPPADADILKSKLRQVLTSENLRSELVKKGHKWVNRFSWQDAAERHLMVYRKVINESYH
uniref:Glycosyltransferase family 1 protein n=1 Tax=candidate division WOR-3 bacterium TaxID=2052148 RepID=A0A7V3PUR5_UNCW3